MSRRNQIIDALLDLFNEDGFTSEFTMSQIAESVNIGKSTIYEYFSNKDELFMATVFKFIENSIDEVRISDDIIDQGFEAAFKAQLSALLKVANKSRRLLEALSPTFRKKLPEEGQGKIKLIVEQMRVQLTQRFTGYFEKGIEEGIIKANQEIENAFVITSLVVGSIISYSNAEEDYGFTIEQVVNKVYDSVLKILN